MIISHGGKPRKLLIRGGSIAAGHGVAKSYADILKDPLSARGIDLINRSRFGETSFDGVDTFHEDIAPFHPDILMIHFGIDDAFFPVYRSEFKENLVHIVRMSRELFTPDIFLLTSHTLDNKYEMDAVNIYYRTIREVAVDLGRILIPVHTWWAGYLAEKGLSNADLVQSDARYPNVKGHEVFAEAIINHLYS
jgi:hypothetical protein